jgi:hypothetical protein
MLIREYRDSDLSALRAIHAAQGFDYTLPDLRNPLFVTKLVLASDSPHAERRPLCSGAACCDSLEGSAPDLGLAPGDSSPAGFHGISRVTSHESPVTEVVGAAFLRLTAEAYLLLDPRAGTPRQRWQWLLALQAAAERDAWQRGLEDVHAWLPPPISKKFGKRLKHLGWLRDDTWTPYCKRLATGN